ncbi:MAG: hypothetical protein WD751_03995 [Anaerolineales bacterium]
MFLYNGGEVPAMSKGRLFLFHWNKPEAEEYAKQLRGQGWEVDFEWEDGARGGNAVKLNPPNAVVFYHTRLPSHSRATAEYLAEAKATRNIPLIFVGGEGEALEKTRKKIASGIFVSEDKLATALSKYAKA